MISRRFWIVPVALGVLVACTGCRIRAVSFSVHEPHHVRAKRVYLPAHHVCSHHCDEHYWDGHGIVVLRGHRHGPGCGHHWDGSHWGVMRKGKVKKIHPRRGGAVINRGHVHGPRCGCVYHPRGRKWIHVDVGHVHGPHCGHVYIDGRWTIRF